MDNLAVSLSKVKLDAGETAKMKEAVKKKVEAEPKPKPKPETKQETAIRLLRTNLDKNGLTDWNIRISRAVKRLGSCQYSKKTISLSSNFIETGTEASILNTILHEIAHALCPGDGHGAKWKAKAIELGCDGKRCAEGLKLNLKYNFECDKGCRASYARKCKMSDWLATGKAKCKKHSLFFRTVVETATDADDEADEAGTDTEEKETEAEKEADVIDDAVITAKEVGESVKSTKPESEPIGPIRIYSKYNYECKEGCFASYGRKCKTVDWLNTGNAKCKKHQLPFKITTQRVEPPVAKPVVKTTKPVVKTTPAEDYDSDLIVE